VHIQISRLHLLRHAYTRLTVSQAKGLKTETKNIPKQNHSSRKNTRKGHKYTLQHGTSTKSIKDLSISKTKRLTEPQKSHQNCSKQNRKTVALPKQQNYHFKLLLET